jgi:hypothetical protein
MAARHLPARSRQFLNRSIDQWSALALAKQSRPDLLDGWAEKQLRF